MQPPPRPEDTRNLIVAVILSIAIIFGFDIFVTGPQRKALIERQRIEQLHQEQELQKPGANVGIPGEPAPLASAGPLARQAALALSERIMIDTPDLQGSIALSGARLDDLALKQYHETTERDSPLVQLFSPQGTAQAQYNLFGWVRPGSAQLGDLPGPDSLWQLSNGNKLTPQSPVTLTYMSAEGLRFTRTITVDERYLFRITDRVENLTDAPQTITPYGIVRRHGLAPDFRPNGVVHEGGVGILNDKREQKTWRALQKEKKTLEVSSSGGWLGLTDKYWLAALLPANSETILARIGLNANVASERIYEASYFGTARTLGARQSIEVEQRLFAGAKQVEILRHYAKSLSVPRLDEAVDWGRFSFLTRPFFEVLHFFFSKFGNFGIAILLLTVVVRLLVFPLADASFRSMAKMKKYQPQMTEIQTKYAADKQKQSQEMMELFKREKINPLAGCFPLLLQMPVFFALFKTLSVTIEMRHAPFFGWIQDLSAPDPSSWVNLFGLLPFDAPTNLPIVGFIFALGIWPLMYGVTMWLVQSMSPPAQDPTQRAVFAWMPVIMTLMFAGFAAGLVIYWTWSNCLSIVQQQFMMRRYGVETELDKLIARLRGKSNTTPPALPDAK